MGRIYSLTLSATFAASIILFMESCSSSNIEPPVNCEQERAALEVKRLEDADCNLENGLIEVEAIGGKGVYQFSINNGPFQSSAIFENLGNGTYLVKVKDENACETTISVNIANKEGVNIELTTVVEAGCGTSGGSITAEPVDGIAPFQYSIDGENFQDENVFENLSRGNYTVTIRDESGCEAGKTVLVPSGVQYSVSIDPIIKNSCAINDCHNGNQFPDFRQFANVKENAAMIKTLTGDGTMPQEGELTQEQINILACWVDDGAPDN